MTSEQQESHTRRNRVNTQLWRTRALMLLGGRCERCGFNDSRALQFDHVDGNGAKHRREVVGRSSYTMSRHVLKHPGKFQVLCANCNWIKREEKREHTLWRDYSQKKEA